MSIINSPFLGIIQVGLNTLGTRVNFTQIALGYRFTIAIDSEGHIYSWGSRILGDSKTRANIEVC